MNDPVASLLIAIAISVTDNFDKEFSEFITMDDRYYLRLKNAEMSIDEMRNIVKDILSDEDFLDRILNLTNIQETYERV